MRSPVAARAVAVPKTHKIRQGRNSPQEPSIVMVPTRRFVARLSGRGFLFAIWRRWIAGRGLRPIDIRSARTIRRIGRSSITGLAPSSRRRCGRRNLRLPPRTWARTALSTAWMIAG